MRYIDLEHISKSLNNQVKALSDYKALTEQQIEATNDNLSTYQNENAFNMTKLSSMVANGVAMSDLNEDLQNSILNAKNAGIDVTELIEKDVYLDEVKANKTDVYSKNESDRKMSDFYTKNEIDEKVTTITNEFNSDDAVDELENAFNAYKEDSTLLINELSKQLNSLKLSFSDVVNISSVETLPDIEVETGREITDLLRETVTVTLDDGNLRNVSVTWQTNTFNKDVDGTYTLKGILNLPNDISNTRTLFASVNVIVSGDTLSIVSVDAVPDLPVEYKTSTLAVLFALPQTVGVTLSDGTKTDVNVTWNMVYYSSTSISDQTIIGRLILNEGITNPKNLKASVKTTIIYHSIISAETIERTYERNYEVLFNLPEIISVTLDDDSIVDMPVSWNTSDVNTESIGVETITGEFNDLPINVSNPENISTQCIATFVENSHNIALVSKIADIKVPLNTNFETIEIDNEIKVTLVDESEIILPISWNHDNYDGTTAGTYYIYGQLVTASTNVTNFNNFTIECAIVVAENEYIDYAWEHRFIVPAGASQIKNFQEKISEQFTENDFYGVYDEETDDYDYTKRKIEIFYLGSTLQAPDNDTLILDDNILSRYIVKTGVIDLYGSNGLLVPLGSEDTSVKDLFDTRVVAAEESSNRSIDFYAGDLIVFENKTSSNQIFLIRKTKHSYVK